jgi:hypothetical protein
MLLEHFTPIEYIIYHVNYKSKKNKQKRNKNAYLLSKFRNSEHGGGRELSEQRQQQRHLEIFPNMGQISRITVGP